MRRRSFGIFPFVTDTIAVSTELTDDSHGPRICIDAPTPTVHVRADRKNRTSTSNDLIREFCGPGLLMGAVNMRELNEAKVTAGYGAIFMHILVSEGHFQTRISANILGRNRGGSIQDSI
jgi:hypothetical protein